MRKDNWDKTRVIVEITGVVILGFAGFFINNTFRQKDLNIKMVEVAINILISPPTKEQTPLRDWAIEGLDKYSEVKLPKEAKNELRIKPINYLLFDGERITFDGEPITVK